MNLTELTDAELEQHRVDVQTELARRECLTMTPPTISDLSHDYTAAGGNPHDLCDTCAGKPPA